MCYDTPYEMVARIAAYFLDLSGHVWPGGLGLDGSI